MEAENNGSHKQPGSASREAKMLQDVCWAVLESEWHFFLHKTLLAGLVLLQGKRNGSQYF